MPMPGATMAALVRRGGPGVRNAVLDYDPLEEMQAAVEAQRQRLMTMVQLAMQAGQEGRAKARELREQRESEMRLAGGEQEMAQRDLAIEEAETKAGAVRPRAIANQARAEALEGVTKQKARARELEAADEARMDVEELQQQEATKRTGIQQRGATERERFRTGAKAPKPAQVPVGIKGVLDDIRGSMEVFDADEFRRLAAQSKIREQWVNAYLGETGEEEGPAPARLQPSPAAGQADIVTLPDRSGRPVTLRRRVQGAASAASVAQQVLPAPAPQPGPGPGVTVPPVPTGTEDALMELLARMARAKARAR